MTETLPIKLETLKNKSIIITGGASGLGRATATKFAEHGAHVTIADIQEEAGEEFASELNERGYKATFIKTDVRDWDSSLAAFKHAVNFSPRKTVDIAALFAGLLSGDPNLPKIIASADPNPSLDRNPEQPACNILKTNLIGVWNCTTLALHYFRLKPPTDAPEVTPGKKSLILVSSLAAYADHAPTEYAAAKWGVRGLFRSIRFSSRDADSNFRVNSLAPGLVPTGPTAGTDRSQPPGGKRSYVMEFSANPKYHVPIEYVVDAASLCATNDEVNGRSFTIWPDGFFDNLEETEDGGGSRVIVQQTEKSGYGEVMRSFPHSV